MRYEIIRGALLLIAATIGLGQTRVDLRSQTRNVDFADATATRPFAVGTTLPAICSPGQAFFKSDAPVGENLYLCTAADTWSSGGGVSVPYFQQFPATANPWIVAGATHGLGSDVEVFVQEDGGATWKRTYPGSVSINKTNGDVTVNWSEPRAGRLMISRLRGGGGAGGGGPHASSHQHGGDDEVATATAAPNAIPKANGAGRLSSAWIPQGAGTDITADLEEEQHAAEHKHGGNDEVATATPGPNEIPKASASGWLTQTWIDPAISRDSEQVAAGDVSGSLSSGYLINNQAVGTGKLKTDNSPTAGWYVRVAPDNGKLVYQNPADVVATVGAASATHAWQHKHGGSDEVAASAPVANGIPKAGSDGTLPAGWINAASVTQHQAALFISASQISGIHTGTNLAADLEEENHAAEHQHGGDDEIAVAEPAPNAIPKAEGSGQLNRGWLPVMSGDAGSGGNAGAVPAPAAGDAVKCLKGDGTWGVCLDHAALFNRDSADQHPASAIANSPSGSVSAASAQGAIDELDAEKIPVASKDQPSGVAGLDETGKILASALPAHNLLSTAHSDTEGIGDEQAGDILRRNSANTAWERIPKGTQYQALLGGSAGPDWGSVALDQSTSVSGILSAGNGGTGNAFTAFAGPDAATKTFTLPNASAAILTNNSAVTVAQGGTGMAAGISGGIPYYSSDSLMASSVALTQNGVVFGGGPEAMPAATAAGSPDQVLRIPSGGGAPAFGALDLGQSAAVIGLLPAGLGGTGNAFFQVAGPASETKTFAFPDANATVLTTNAAVTVAQGGTGIASGTSGGIPFFADAAVIASSPALAANAIVLGGGPGAAPHTSGNLTVQAVGTNGTEPANAGDNISLARSDHEHLIPWQLAIPFTGAPALGDFAVRLPVPASCGGSISASSVRVIASTKGTGAMTFQVYSCTNGASETCSSMFSGGNQTYSNTGNVSQQVNTDQNNTGLATTSFFKANIASVNGQSGVTLIVNGRCKNI